MRTIGFRFSSSQSEISQAEIFGLNKAKYGLAGAPYSDTFHAVTVNKLFLIFFRQVTEKHLQRILFLHKIFLVFNYLTAWKVSKYGVTSHPYFPVFWLNTVKNGPEIATYLDTIHAVCEKKAAVREFLNEVWDFSQHTERFKN